MATATPAQTAAQTAAALAAKQNLIKLGVTAAVLFAMYKFAPNAAVKAMALGAAGVVILKNTPVVNTYVAI